MTSDGALTDAAPERTPDGDTVATETGGGGGNPADAQPVTVPCAGGTEDLSNVAAGDFKITFHIVTTQTGWAALINQRATCDYSLFWDLRQSLDGTISFEIDSGDINSYESLESTVAVNDGKPHDIVVSRVSGALVIQIDGASAGQRASSAALGALPLLRVTDDVCDATVADPPTAPFAGTALSNICINRS